MTNGGRGKLDAEPNSAISGLIPQFSDLGEGKIQTGRPDFVV
jgi:hypothetical protein